MSNTDDTLVIAEACKPWELCSGDPPPWDSPLMNVWQAAICWTLAIVGKSLGAEDWEGGDGSETLDGDVSAEVTHIMRAAGLVNRDGDPITREDAAVIRASTMPSQTEVAMQICLARQEDGPCFKPCWRCKDGATNVLALMQRGSGRASQTSGQGAP